MHEFPHQRNLFPECDQVHDLSKEAVIFFNIFVHKVRAGGKLDKTPKIKAKDFYEGAEKGI